MVKPWEMNWGNQTQEISAKPAQQPWKKDWTAAKQAAMANDNINPKDYNGMDLVGKDGEDAKPFEKMQLFMDKLFTFEVRSGKEVEEKQKKNKNIQALEKIRQEPWNSVNWKEVGKAGARSFLEIGKGVTAHPFKIYGDWMRDERDQSLMSAREKLDVKYNNMLADSYIKLGNYIEKFWDWGLQSEWLKPDENIFKGSFVENPSLTRALSAAASGVSSIGWFGGVAKITGSRGVASALLASADADDIYFEAREKGVSQNKALGLYAVGTAGTAVLEKYGFEQIFNQRVTAPLAKRVVKSMLSEGLTEGGQTLWQNLVKRIGYNDAQELMENVIESVIGGSLSGGVVSAADGGYIKLQQTREKLKAQGMSDADLDTIQEAIGEELGKHGDTVNALFQERIDGALNKFDEFIKANEGTEQARKAIQTKAELEEVYNQINDALIKDAKVNPEKANAYAKIWQGIALWGAEETGTSPLAFMEQHAPQIKKESFAQFSGQTKDVLDGDYIPFQFAGENARTADISGLDQAKSMSDVGYDSELIRGQTGWFMGADGKWRFEISDKEATINQEAFDKAKSLDNLYIQREQLLDDIKAFDEERKNNKDAYPDGYLDDLINKRYDEIEKIDYDISHGFVAEPEIALDELLNHDKLFAAYPFLRNMTVKIKDSKATEQGSYSKKDNTIYLDSRIFEGDEVKSVLMHEIQHAIQDYEGFSRGGNMELAKAYRKIIKTKEAKDFHKSLERKITEAMIEQLKADGIKEEDAEKLADSYGKYLNAIFDDSLDPQEVNKIEKEYYDLLDKLGVDFDQVENAYKAIRDGRDLWQEALDETKSKLSEADAYEIYKAFYGEVEARNTQKRMDMSDEERISQSPESTQDIKNADALVVFPDGIEIVYKNIYNPDKVSVKNGIVDLTNAFEKSPKPKDVRNYLKEVLKFGNEFLPLSKDWIIDVKNNAKKRSHISIPNHWNNMSDSQKREHNKYAMAFKYLIENAEYVSSQNNKKTEEKQDIAKYHYFKTTVKIGDHIFDVILDTEQNVGEKEDKPQTVHLYNLEDESVKRASLERNTKTSSKDSISQNGENVNREKGVYLDTGNYDQEINDLQSMQDKNAGANLYGKDIDAFAEQWMKKNEEEQIDSQPLDDLLATVGYDSLEAINEDIQEGYNWKLRDKTFENEEELEEFLKKTLKEKIEVNLNDLSAQDWENIREEFSNANVREDFFDKYQNLVAKIMGDNGFYAKEDNSRISDSRYIEVYQNEEAYNDGEEPISKIRISDHNTHKFYGNHINLYTDRGIAEEINKLKDAFARGDFGVDRTVYQGNQSQTGRGGTARGAYSNNIIYLFEHADASTFMHETAHWFFEELANLNTAKTNEMRAKIDEWANNEFDKRYKVIETENGFAVADKTGNIVYGEDQAFNTLEQARDYAKNELFARGFEQYLRDGKAPNNYLKEAFRSFLNWLRRLYKAATELNVDLNDDIRNVFGQILGGENLDFYLEAPVDEILQHNFEMNKDRQKANDDIISDALNNMSADTYSDVWKYELHDLKKAAQSTKRIYKEKREMVKKAGGDLIDKIITPIDTRLNRINPKLKNRMVNYEARLGIKLNNYYRQIKPFMDIWKTFSRADLTAFDLALKNGYMQKQLEIVNKYNAYNEFVVVKNVLANIFDNATQAGIELGYLPDYFPRAVKDANAFLQYLEGDAAFSPLRRQLDAWIEEQRENNLEPTPEEKIEFINRYMMGFRRNESIRPLPGNTKDRMIDIIDKDMNKFYKPSMDALISYIEGMNAAIEQRKLFGRDAKNIANTIGAWVDELMANQEITPEQDEEVRQIFAARFSQRGVSNKYIAFARDASYIYTMGGINSAITQFDDIFMSIYENGVFESGKELFADNIEGLSRQDLGLESIGQEYSEKSLTSELVNKTFKLTGLDKIDSLMKTKYTNATFKKFQKMAKEDPEALRERIEPIMEELTPKVMEDLREGRITEDVQVLMFNALSEFQPISLSQMPEGYLRSGNLRVLYMLKTFTLKRIDTFRRKCLDEYRKGNKKQALQNLFRLSLIMMLCGMAKDALIDMLYGRPFNISDMVVNNILGLVGLSKFQLYKLRDDGVDGFLFSLTVPPVKPLYTDLLRDLPRVWNGKKELKDLEAFKGIPLIGRFYYWWIGGGRAKIEKQKNKGKKKLK